MCKADLVRHKLVRSANKLNIRQEPLLFTLQAAILDCQLGAGEDSLTFQEIPTSSAGFWPTGDFYLPINVRLNGHSHDPLAGDRSSGKSTEFASVIFHCCGRNPTISALLSHILLTYFPFTFIFIFYQKSRISFSAQVESNLEIIPGKCFSKLILVPFLPHRIKNISKT